MILRSLALVALAALAGCAHDPRPWVHSLRFQGVRQVSERELRKKLVTRATSWFTITRKKYLSPSVLEQDKQRIATYYATRGYFGARVLSCEVRPRRKGSVDIRIRVDEGPATRVAWLRLAGLEGLEGGQELAASFALRTGDVFDHERYLREKAVLLERLRQRGHAFAQVAGHVRVDRDARRAEVELLVTTGPRASFGPVVVEGTRRVEAWRLARYADLPQGQAFTPEALEIARGRLHNLGLFSSVYVEPEHDPARPDVVVTRISVAEAKTRQLRVGLGLGFESQRTDVHARLSFTQLNFLGGLRTLQVRLDPGWVVIPAFWDPQQNGPQLAAEAQLSQPDLPWRRAELRVALGYDLTVEYGYRYHGPHAQIGVSWPLWLRRLRLGVNYGFQFLLFFDTDPGLLQDPLRAGQLYGYTDPYRLGWLQQQVALDLRDQPLGTRSGVFLSLVAEQSGAWSGSQFTYESLVGDARGYLPFGERVVFAARFKFGQIFVQGGLASPITRRLYLGGADSHRGFNYNRLSPQIPSGDTNVPAIPVGGDQLLLGTAELRVALFRLWGSWVAAAAFVDSGDVAPAGQRVDLRRIHYAVGGGLRYATAVGTIRADLGVRLNRLNAAESDGTPNPDPGQRVVFHISIGEAF